jgi:hypothetical protein
MLCPNNEEHGDMFSFESEDAPFMLTYICLECQYWEERYAV